MARSIDWTCSACGLREWGMANVDDTRECPSCHQQMEQDWLPRIRRAAQWDDATAVMVLVNDDPSCPPDVRTRYVGSHSARVPAGYHPVYLRSLQAVNKFEREHSVANEAMHFDRNGRGLDDYVCGQKLTH